MTAAADLIRARITRFLSPSQPQPRAHVEPVQPAIAKERDWLSIKHERPEEEPSVLHPVVKVKDIVSAVSRSCGVSVMEIASNRRQVNLARARFATVYLAKEMTARSYPEIGRVLGGRDHTTIMHSYRRACELMSTDEAFVALVEEIRGYLAPEAA